MMRRSGYVRTVVNLQSRRMDCRVAALRAGPAMTRRSVASRCNLIPLYSNSMITASTARLSPGLALILATVPSRSARNTFSIFIASTTQS